MKKRVVALLLLIVLFLTSCENIPAVDVGTIAIPKINSDFCITFFDVGEGDAALVECDGHCMLIDGGTESKGQKIYDVLAEKEIKNLDILAISHFHEDHIGGLAKAISYPATIGITLSNSESGTTNAFSSLKGALNGKSTFTIPKEGEVFSLGSANVEAVYVANSHDNDSLVLLVTYGKTRFLFTGDIEEKAQEYITNKYRNEDTDEPYKIDLIKMPHHGSDKSEKDKMDDSTKSLYSFLRTFMPEYAIISVGQNNKYDHPGERTLSELRDLDATVYRTDYNGDIIVKSNGNKITVTPSK